MQQQSPEGQETLRRFLVQRDIALDIVLTLHFPFLGPHIYPTSFPPFPPRSSLLFSTLPISSLLFYSILLSFPLLLCSSSHPGAGMWHIDNAIALGLLLPSIFVFLFSYSWCLGEVLKVTEYFWGTWVKNFCRGNKYTWGNPCQRALFSLHDGAAGCCHKIGLIVLFAISRRGVVIGSKCFDLLICFHNKKSEFSSYFAIDILKSLVYRVKVRCLWYIMNMQLYISDQPLRGNCKYKLSDDDFLPSPIPSLCSVLNGI